MGRLPPPPRNVLQGLRVPPLALSRASSRRNGAWAATTAPGCRCSTSTRTPRPSPCRRKRAAAVAGAPVLLAPVPVAAPVAGRQRRLQQLHNRQPPLSRRTACLLSFRRASPIRARLTFRWSNACWIRPTRFLILTLRPSTSASLGVQTSHLASLLRMLSPKAAVPARLELSVLAMPA